MPKICVIFNPTARSGRARRAIRSLRLEEKGCTLWPTQTPMDAQRLARKAAEEDFDVVVAAGGDGTLNEVINGLANHALETKLSATEQVRRLMLAAQRRGETMATANQKENFLGPTLGVLPLGTVNVFARELGLSLNPKQAWAVIEQNRSRPIDLVRANDRWFIQMAGVGFDARVIQKTSVALKKKIGFLAFLVTAVRISMHAMPRLVAFANGQSFEGSLVLVGNGRLYTGWIRQFPTAKLDDGQFEVCLWQGKGLGGLLWFVWNSWWGKHPYLRNVKYFSTQQLNVSAKETPLPFEVEGEFVANTPVEFTIQSGALRVLAP